MLAVIFGGRSCEHNVSIVTGVMALNALGGKAKGIYIDKSGEFWCGDKLSDLKTYENFKTKGLKRVHFMPSSSGVYTDGGKTLFRAKAAVVCCHGAYGEDGCLQGLLEISGIPYTCGGVLASAVGMDKEIMKRLFNEAGLPCVRYVSVTRKEFDKGGYDFVQELKEDFTFPLIVKPANLGSSIGISLARDYETLFESMRTAFAFDSRVLIEQALENFTEVNCAVIGDGDDAEASLTEQPIGWTEFLSYEDKYLGKGKTERHKIPAPIDEKTAEKVKEYAKRAFRATQASGVARVDFLLAEDNTLYVNEINTVPGSLAYYLFEDRYTLAELLDRLVAIALKRAKTKNALTYTYSAGIKHGK